MQQGNLVETLRQLEGMPVSSMFGLLSIISQLCSVRRPRPNFRPMYLKSSHRISPATMLYDPWRI